MRDEKRKIRELKRQLKRAGTKKLRRFLKDVSADPDQFAYGRHRSEVLNEPRTPRQAAREDRFNTAGEEYSQEHPDE